MAAQIGTLTISTKSGTMQVDTYIPDAAAGLLGFNPTGAAASTSPTQYRIPVDGVITDLSVAAAPTATAVALTKNGAIMQGGVVRYANVLNTLPYRIPLRIALSAGDFIGGINLS